MEKNLKKDRYLQNLLNDRHISEDDLIVMITKEIMQLEFILKNFQELQYSLTQPILVC